MTPTGTNGSGGDGDDPDSRDDARSGETAGNSTNATDPDVWRAYWASVADSGRRRQVDLAAADRVHLTGVVRLLVDANGELEPTCEVVTAEPVAP
jgi:hypothetical protein